MPLIAVFLFILIIAGQEMSQTVQDKGRQEKLAETRHTRTILLSQLVNRYLDERGGTPPASLAALAATPGYESARQFLNASGPHGEGPFLVVYPLNNGTNTYNRVIVYNPPFDGSISATDYLIASHNTCGTTAASAIGNWCGDPKGSYWTTDTLSRISAEVARERTQQQITLKKFAAYYNATYFTPVATYPDPGGGDGSAVTLISQLSGYSLTATTCTGVWNWQGIPLTCDDLYTIWGTPRVYNFLAKNMIALYAEAPWQESGQPIVVASQLDDR